MESSDSFSSAHLSRTVRRDPGCRTSLCPQAPSMITQTHVTWLLPTSPPLCDFLSLLPSSSTLLFLIVPSSFPVPLYSLLFPQLHRAGACSLRWQPGGAVSSLPPSPWFPLPQPLPIRSPCLIWGVALNSTLDYLFNLGLPHSEKLHATRNSILLVQNGVLGPTLCRACTRLSASVCRMNE